MLLRTRTNEIDSPPPPDLTKNFEQQTYLIMRNFECVRTEHHEDDCATSEKRGICFHGTLRDKLLNNPVVHGVLASTLPTILKGNDAIIHANSSGIASKKNNLKDTYILHEKLEEALFTWFKDMRAKNGPLSGEVVQQKALCFA